jgi:hypothetical protein
LPGQQPPPFNPILAQPAVAVAPPLNAAASPAQRAGGSNGILKGIAIFFIVRAAVGLIGLAVVVFIVWRFLPVGQLFGRPGQSSFAASRDSSASVFSGSLGTAELGIEIYPGAEVSSPVSRSDSPGSITISATFTTPAEMAKVVDFYRARMVGKTSIYANGGGVVVTISRSPQDSIDVVIAPARNGALTRIDIDRTVSKISTPQGTP